MVGALSHIENSSPSNGAGVYCAAKPMWVIVLGIEVILKHRTRENTQLIADISNRALSCADAVDALQGRWRLVFGSKAPASFLQYIPVYEVADIDKTTSTIDLSSDIGPLKFRRVQSCLNAR